MMAPADTADLICLGRAYVRLIEAADVLLAAKLDPLREDMIDLQAAREFAKRKLREIVEDAEPAVTAEIMAASMKALGTVQDLGKNWTGSADSVKAGKPNHTDTLMNGGYSGDPCPEEWR